MAWDRTSAATAASLHFGHGELLPVQGCQQLLVGYKGVLWFFVGSCWMSPPPPVSGEKCDLPASKVEHGETAAKCWSDELLGMAAKAYM